MVDKNHIANITVQNKKHNKGFKKTGTSSVINGALSIIAYRPDGAGRKRVL